MSRITISCHCFLLRESGGMPPAHHPPKWTWCPGWSADPVVRPPASPSSSLALEILRPDPVSHLPSPVGSSLLLRRSSYLRRAAHVGPLRKWVEKQGVAGKEFVWHGLAFRGRRGVLRQTRLSALALQETIGPHLPTRAWERSLDTTTTSDQTRRPTEFKHI